MNIADRIQELRKQKGISQEELADRLGVSRQAVSKREAEQSVPELDKIIRMSDYFEVTTDYILKGAEPAGRESRTEKRTGNTLSLLAPYMAWIGYLLTCALWYEYQNAFAIASGFIWLLGSVLIIYAAELNGLADQKALNRYWLMSFPVISLFLSSLVLNVLCASVMAPYPLISDGRFVLTAVWLFVWVCVNAAVLIVLHKNAAA